MTAPDTHTTARQTALDAGQLDLLDLDRAPRWLLTTEAAAILGISPRTLRRRLAKGHLRVSRPAGGRRLLIDRDSLRELIESAAR